MRTVMKVLLKICEKVAEKHNLTACKKEQSVGKFPIRNVVYIVCLLSGGYFGRKAGLPLGKVAIIVGAGGLLTSFKIVKSMRATASRVLPRSRPIKDLVQEMTTAQKIKLASNVANVIKSHTNLNLSDESRIMDALDKTTELLILNEMITVLGEDCCLDVCISDK
ncbi:uncharacterized protein LOC114328857 [Diabrotica virgifera virgifera]|uniref:Uncharacterized protein n=1 Tax=Diabrotica virgifera virgifera TaxID=50390 RepID=A0ABM5IIH7_DIAVI|nr:uncharacterized protein LOC114328857 [Diabrotica virgifera virgifera]